MKKLIILFLILGILIIGCSNRDYRQQPNPQPPAIGGGCSVTTENENEQTKIKYVGVEAGL